MAVAPDASSRAHADDNSQAEASFTWNHPGAASGVRGILIPVFQLNDSTNRVTSVTYGGVNVPAVTGGRAVDTLNEPGSTEFFYLGSNVPQGTNAVVVNRVNNAARLSAFAFTVFADFDTEITGIVLEQENQTLTEENVNDGSPGTNSLRVVAIFSGLGAVSGLTPGANTTHLQDNDPGTAVTVFGRETTAGQGSRPVGYTANTDDVAAVYGAIREIVGSTITLSLISGTTVFAPQVRGQVLLAHIASTSVLAPQINGRVTLALIASTQLFAPTTTGQIQLGLISSTTVFSPTVGSMEIELELISSTTVFDPQINGQVALDLISSTQIFSPTTAGQIQLAHISSTQVFSPSTAGQIQLGLISSTVVFTPAVGFTTITLDHISSTSVFAPQVNGQVTLGHITGTQIFAPQVNGQVVLALIATTQIFAPAVPSAILLALISSTQVFAVRVATFVYRIPVSVVSNDGWDTSPTPGGDIDAALTADDADYITVTV